MSGQKYYLRSESLTNLTEIIWSKNKRWDRVSQRTNLWPFENCKQDLLIPKSLTKMDRAKRVWRRLKRGSLKGRYVRSPTGSLPPSPMGSPPSFRRGKKMRTKSMMSLNKIWRRSQFWHMFLTHQHVLLLLSCHILWAFKCKYDSVTFVAYVSLDKS